MHSKKKKKKNWGSKQAWCSPGRSWGRWMLLIRRWGGAPLETSRSERRGGAEELEENTLGLRLPKQSRTVAKMSRVYSSVKINKWVLSPFSVEGMCVCQVTVLGFFACFWGVDVKNGFMCKKYLWQVNEQDMQQRATGQTETCRSCSEDTALVHKEHTAYDTLLVVWCYCYLSRLLCIAVLHRLHAGICVCTGENYFIFKNVPRKSVAM